MLRKYVRRISNQNCPVVLSITETNTVVEATETVIQRNGVREVSADFRGSNELYVRARDIYFRARSHRPVRAASIF